MSDSVSNFTKLSATDVLEGVTDYVMLLDARWNIIYLNAEARRLIAKEVPVVGRNLWELFPKSDNTHIRKTMERALESGRGARFQFYGPDLESWFDLSVRPVADDVVAIAFHDIGGDHSASAQLQPLQNHDADDEEGLPSIANLSEQIRRLADRISQVSSDLPAPLDSSSNRQWADRDLARVAEGIYRDRRLRRASFPQLALAEPQWDILLDLFVQTVAGRHVSVSSACIASDAAASTALRALSTLAEHGLIERRPDQLDSRRTWVELTPDGKRAMIDYLKKVGLPRLSSLAP